MQVADHGGDCVPHHVGTHPYSPRCLSAHCGPPLRPMMTTLLEPRPQTSPKEIIDATELTALSLFSGAGGLDLGLDAAGWTVLGQVELDADCTRTLDGHLARMRHQGEILAMPIEEVSPQALRRKLGLARGELALLAGGPPCQPFTTSGLRKALLDRRASSLFPAYLEFVDEFRPRSLLLENVDGMLSAALRHRPLAERTTSDPPLREEEMKGSFLRWLVSELTGFGYAVSWGVVEVADHGVPQLRQRAILIASRGSTPCFLPAPSFGRPGLPDHRTIAGALASIKELGAVQPLSERKRAVYRLIPPGGNWRDLPDAVRRKTMGGAYFAEGGRSGWWRRLDWNTPSPTILGMPDHSSTALVHPEEVRCLSVNECAALQTFPRWARFAGAPRSQYQQIGNAVPPLLGKVLGRHLAAYLAGDFSEEPGAPEWRKNSANRRIGTHGWAVPQRGGGMAVTLRHVRADHVWKISDDCQDGNRRGGSRTG